ncbi:unnamed protein product [Mytilus edulis]|uniref:Uncharacterized protein n=1 Tax=Mytilus edulis TaxID=6550 RepID=A0A8S3SZF1_MYTED|nr:unnamed protein product [Mytilus edulis]
MISLLADYGESGPLSFMCPGMSGIVSLEHGTNIHDVCGPEFELLFNGSHTNLHNAHLTFHFSSFPNTMHAVPLHHNPYNMGAVHTEWSLSSSIDIDQAEIPCGAGYILAVIDDMTNGMTYDAAQRGVMVCDFSDIDVELEVEMVQLNHTITLTAGSGTIMEQMQHQGAAVHRIMVRNNGNRRVNNVTMENPHVVSMYLRRHGSHETHTPMCSVPSYTLDDAMLGGMMFMDGIEPHHAHEVEEDKDMPISVNFDEGLSICGDAELVMMLDPLGMMNDSNPCNNFARLSVYVDCSHLMAKDFCMVVSNAMKSGWEANMIFQDKHSHEIKMYHYQAMDSYWQGRDAHNHENHIEQVGLAKYVLLKKKLSMLYMRHNDGNFPCKTVIPMMKRRMKMDRIMDFSDYTLDSTRMNTMQNLKTRLMNMNAMANNDDLRYEIEMFGNDTFGISNDIMRSQVQGMAMGMQMAMGLKYGIGLAQMYGQPIPHNMTRTILGPALEGMGKIIKETMGQKQMMKEYMMSSLVYHAASTLMMIHTGLFHLPMEVGENLENMLYNIMDFPETILNDTTEDCDHSHAERTAMHLRYLSLGHDWEEWSYVDQSICNDLMVPSYMAHGGAMVLAKDIYDAVAGDGEMPKMCRPHLYMPEDKPPVIWKVKDGRVMMGIYSPLGDVVTWKATAVCRCDGCPTDPNAMHTTSYYNGHEMTTNYGG